MKAQNHDDLVALRELVEAGKVTPVIDGTYPLSDTPKAIARVTSGRARGTIVITVVGRETATGSDEASPQIPAREAVAPQALAS